MADPYANFWRDLHKTALASYEHKNHYVCPCGQHYKLTESVAFVAHIRSCKAKPGVR